MYSRPSPPHYSTSFTNSNQVTPSSTTSRVPDSYPPSDPTLSLKHLVIPRPSLPSPSLASLPPSVYRINASPSPTETIRPLASTTVSPSPSPTRGPLPPVPPSPLSALASTRPTAAYDLSTRASAPQNMTGVPAFRMGGAPEDSLEDNGTRHGGGRGNAPEYEQLQDPFADERAAPGLNGRDEKARLMVGVASGRGAGEGGSREQDDAGSSRSAEIGGRDHLERWRKEQTNLEAREKERRVRPEMRGASTESGSGGSGSGNTSFSGASAGQSIDRFDERSLAAMSDAEIAQHHFRLAQQHLEAAQRLAMAAAQAPGPPPSAPTPPPNSGTPRKDQKLGVEDVFPPSSSSSHTEYPESAVDDSTDSPISPQSYGAYRTTYSRSAQDQSRRQGSETDSWSEFGRLNLDGRTSIVEAKRSRSLSNVAPTSSAVPLSSISEKAPPLPSPSPSVFDSKSLPNSSSYSLSSMPPPQQQYPPRTSSNTLPGARIQRRPSTAEQVTPRAIRRSIRRSQPTGQETRQLCPPPPPRPSASDTVYESASSMVPSLYGGTLPRGMTDRIGSLPVPSSTSSSSSTHSELFLDCRSRRHQEAFELESSIGGYSEDGYQDLDDIDSMSDFHDVQSTFSHVTNATLPPYEYRRRFSQVSVATVPPVPSIPPAFLQNEQQVSTQAHQTTPLRSQPSFSCEMSLNSSTPLIPNRQRVSNSRTGGDEDEFHGFRPRLGVQPYGTVSSQRSPNLPTDAPYPVTQSAQWIPARQNPQDVRTEPSRQQRVYASGPAPLQMQPHSYILGADGRPIPVYASLPAPSAPPAPGSSSSMTAPRLNDYYRSSAAPPASVSRQPLPIHAQPLQFDHSIHINPIRQHRPQPHHLAIPSSSTFHPSSPRGGTTSTTTARAAAASVPTSHAYHLPPPSSFTQPSLPQPLATSVAPYQQTLRPPSTTPSSTSSEPSSTTSAAATATRPPSIMPFLKRNRLASTSLSLRKMVKSPHVRFKSPEPPSSSSLLVNENETNSFSASRVEIGSKSQRGGGEETKDGVESLQQSLGNLW